MSRAWRAAAELRLHLPAGDPEASGWKGSGLGEEGGKIERPRSTCRAPPCASW